MYHRYNVFVLNNGFLILLILSAVLTSLFLLSKNSLLMWFRASETTFSYANIYVTIYTAGTFFALISGGMNSFLIAQGFSGLGMATVVIGAVLNILLDPLFIFVLHMGVTGAAIATVISQIISCLFVLGCLFSKRMPVRLDCTELSSAHHHAYGGITLGSQPVVSFNYGKGDVQRIKKAILYITGLCVSFCILITVVIWAASPVYVRLFTEDPEILHRSVTYIKRFTFMIIPLAIQYPLVDETTALGKVKLALFCSAFRKFIFLAGLIFLPALFTADAAFFSEPVADVVSATMTSCLFFFHFFPKILKEREHVTI